MNTKTKKKQSGYDALIRDFIKWGLVAGAIALTLYMLATWGSGETGAEKLNALFIRLTILFGVALAVVGYNVWQKIKWQKDVVGHVYVEHITKEGNGYAELVPVSENGLVEIKRRKDKRLRTYVISDLSTYNVPYPPGKWSFKQSPVKKTVIDDETWEAMTNRRGEFNLSPARLNSIINEKHSIVTQLPSEEDKQVKTVVRTGSWGLNKMWFIVIALLVIGIIATLYAYFMKNQELKDSLGIAMQYINCWI